MKKISFMVLFVSTFFFATTLLAKPFTSDFEIQKSNYTLSDHENGYCYVSWSMNVKNKTNQDVRFHGSVEVEQNLKNLSRLTIVRTEQTRLNAGTIESISGVDRIQNCQKERVTEVELTGSTVDKEEK